MLTADRPVLSRDEARVVLDAARGDALLYAAVSLMLYAGLRSSEVEDLKVVEYAPIWPSVRTGTDRFPRSILIARSAAAAVNAYLATQETEPDEPLLVGLRRSMLARVLRAAGRDASVGVHDLRRTAITAVLATGVPMPHVGAYFGMSKVGVGELVPVPEGYDAPIAAALEAAFS